MVEIYHKGNFNKIEKFFNHALGRSYLNVLDKYGQLGIKALQEATPVDTGKTAESWGYEISDQNGVARIAFTNTNVQNYVNIAIILDTGHATRNGGWVEGKHYLRPALRAIFESMAEEAWKEVTG